MLLEEPLNYNYAEY